MPVTSYLGEYRTFEASAARTATGTGTAFDTADWDVVTAQVRVTAAAGTTPTLVVRIQTTYDDGATWTDIAVVAAAITGVDRRILSVAPVGATSVAAAFAFAATDGAMPVATLAKPVALGTQCRFQWTIGGVTPSFTFAITGVVRRLA